MRVPKRVSGFGFILEEPMKSLAMGCQSCQRTLLGDQLPTNRKWYRRSKFGEIIQSRKKSWELGQT